MDIKHKFEMQWDNEKDMLHVSCGTKEMSFSKEFLKDMPSWQFVKYLDKLSDGAYQSLTNKYWNSQYMNEPPPYKPPKAETIAALCLPHIKQIWHTHTGGSVNNLYKDYSTDTYNLVMSQGFALCLPNIIFEDEKYAHLDMILGWLSKHWQSLKHVAGYDFYISKDTYYDLGFIWPSLAPKPPQVKALHVYDMGDGMLVPCELAAAIASFGMKKHQGWTFSTEMVEDDLYGAIPKDTIHKMIQAEAAKIDAALMENLKLQVYPNKHLTDKDAWFLIEDEMGKFDIIDPGQYYGKSIAEMLAKPPTVAIPKNPKQITKATLEHFHKLLGGKKNPY